LYAIFSISLLFRARVGPPRRAKSALPARVRPARIVAVIAAARHGTLRLDDGYEREMKTFLEYVLGNYERNGAKVADVLRIRYGGVNDAKRMLGSVDGIRHAFVDIQGHLFR
jgi:hypothetical protein